MGLENNSHNGRSGEQVEAINREREEEIARQTAVSLHIPYLDLRLTGAHHSDLTLVEEKKARAANLAVAQKQGHALKVVVQDSQDPKTIEVIEDLKKKYEVQVFIVSRSSLKDMWGHYPKKEVREGLITKAMGIGGEALLRFQEQIKSKSDLSAALDEIATTNATQVFELLMGASLNMNTSDMHIEPDDAGATIRMRIDGILYDVAQINMHLYELLLSRIKLLSQLKINIHDAPQEGRFSVALKERTVEVRTSILPSEYGEDIALRILDPRFLLSLEELGIRPDLREKIESQLSVPQGLILTTGPTGSGKTTTLYAFIAFLKNKEIKIVTIEDPVEYHLDGISQTQIDPDEGYTFESGLRAILRQDADIVLLSELRDQTAADAALQAALAGRRVLTTLHTNDAAGAVPRLLDMGIDAATISSGLSLVIAQRLLRRLCPACKIKKKMGTEMYGEISKILKNIPATIKIPDLSENYTLYYASETGCAECGDTGYRGRIGVFEVVVSDKDIRTKILEIPSEDEMKDYAIEKGMTTMRQDAVLKMLEGVTSFEEIERVLGEKQESAVPQKNTPQL